MFVAILMLLFILHFFTGNAAVQHKNNAKNEPEDKEQLIKSDDEPQEYQKSADSEEEIKLPGAKIISPFASYGTKIVGLTVSRSSESLDSSDDEQLVGRYLPMKKSSKKTAAMKALKNRDEQEAKSEKDDTNKEKYGKVELVIKATKKKVLKKGKNDTRHIICLTDSSPEDTEKKKVNKKTKWKSTWKGL